MSTPPVKIIVNPAAGAGSTERKWPHINRQLRHLGLSFDHEFTESPGHAVELARTAVDNGCRYIVAVGGDGTVHEVANGVLSSGDLNKTALGVIGTGTGSDFARSMGIPRNCDDACLSLTGSEKKLIDVGVVEYMNEGQKQRRFFLNAAGVGFDAEVVAATERFPKYLGGTIPYLAGLLRCLFGYRNKPVDLCLEDEARAVRILTVVVANGSYFGGGMHMAPQALLDDGLMDVMTISDIGKFELLKALPTIYKGTHITHPKVSMEKARQVTIKSTEQLLVHADGELIGRCPASFWLVPAALSIVL